VGTKLDAGYRMVRSGAVIVIASAILVLAISGAATLWSG
jgi:hypothetical protein